MDTNFSPPPAGPPLSQETSRMADAANRRTMILVRQDVSYLTWKEVWAKFLHFGTEDPLPAIVARLTEDRSLLSAHLATLDKQHSTVSADIVEAPSNSGAIMLLLPQNLGQWTAFSLLRRLRASCNHSYPWSTVSRGTIDTGFGRACANLLCFHSYRQIECQYVWLKPLGFSYPEIKSSPPGRRSNLDLSFADAQGNKRSIGDVQPHIAFADLSAIDVVVFTIQSWSTRYYRRFCASTPPKLSSRLFGFTDPPVVDNGEVGSLSFREACSSNSLRSQTIILELLRSQHPRQRRVMIQHKPFREGNFPTRSDTGKAADDMKA
ncbi:hypothetical protein B0H14DRAFT_3500491 [Mycena olivaceomarginata]|nr:hypothetical protein B0H14DRAFT_3500491 [Mycena olivaceomarginata]